VSIIGVLSDGGIVAGFHDTVFTFQFSRLFINFEKSDWIQRRRGLILSANSLLY